MIAKFYKKKKNSEKLKTKLLNKFDEEREKKQPNNTTKHFTLWPFQLSNEQMHSFYVEICFTSPVLRT